MGNLSQEQPAAASAPRMTTRWELVRHVEPMPEGKRRGRPPKEPPWLEAAANLAVDKVITLGKALRMLGVELSMAERKKVYRWQRFKFYVEQRHRDRSLADIKRVYDL